MIRLPEPEVCGDTHCKVPTGDHGKRAELALGRPQGMLVIAHPPGRARVVTAGTTAQVSIERRQVGATQIRHGAVPELAPEGMQSEPAHALACTPRIELLERPHDRGMQRAPAIL